MQCHLVAIKADSLQENVSQTFLPTLKILEQNQRNRKGEVGDETMLPSSYKCLLQDMQRLKKMSNFDAIGRERQEIKGIYFKYLEIKKNSLLAFRFI